MRSGKRAWLSFALLTSGISATYAQTPGPTGQCSVTSAPSQLRAEGITETVGDILLQCTSTPRAVLTGNFTVVLPASVTNRVGSTNLVTDAIAFADLGTGFTPLPTAAQITNSQLVLNGLSFTVPDSGSFRLAISNIRIAASQLNMSGSNPLAIQAQILFNGAPLALSQNTVTVGFVQSGLLASMYNRGVLSCAGSALPATISMTNLFAKGTFFASNRLTEGFAAAFRPKQAGEDSGTRFVLQFSTVPAGMRLFVPDFIAGSSAAVPTAGGDLGGVQSGGMYTTGSGTLLLARVPNADSSGAGGAPSALTGSGSVALDSVSEVAIANGNGYAVYEVLDAQSSRQESAQIPVFVGLDPAVAQGGSAQESISFAPISTVQTASAGAPVPRFSGTTPAGDCSAVGDCSASYYPKLSITTPGFQFSAIVSGAAVGQGYVSLNNTGGGVMAWSATIQYANGSGWASLSKTAGTGDATLYVGVDPKGLTAGTYRATVEINAGSAGTGSAPITLVISPVPTGPPTLPGGSSSGSGTASGTGAGSSGSGSPASGGGSGTGSGSTPPATNPGAGPASGSGTTNPPPPAVVVTVSKIVNAATFDSTPLVPGSLGTVMGSNLAGKNVAVTFDGAAADLVYSSATQINLLVPASLRGKNSASLVITVDGVASAPQTVILAPAWPAVFAHGVANQDNRVNGPEAGAAPGTILQIYGTGIPEGATVSVQIGGRNDLIPLYAGAAPDVPGVQQVNVAVPEGIAPGVAPLVICATVSSQPFCSPAFSLAVQ